MQYLFDAVTGILYLTNIVLFLNRFKPGSYNFLAQKDKT